MFARLLLLVASAAAIAIDNGVLEIPGVSNPIVTCGNEGFELLINVQNSAFFRQPDPEGRMFIKGLSGSTNPRCLSFSVDRTPNSPMVLARLMFDACERGVTSRRDANGLTRSVTLIISFHRFFITKVDRAFEVNCQYRSPMKTVTVPLGVSMLPTQSIQQTLTMPTCIYQILDRATERPIRYASIGDKVLHRWTCGGVEDAARWCMRVHSCGLVSDPQPRFIDNDGCTLDRFILGNPNYELGALEAEVEAHTFKLPDIQDISFRCSVRLMPRLNGGSCEPLQCPLQGRGRRELPRAEGKMSLNESEQEVDRALSVLDIPTGGMMEEQRRLTRLANHLDNGGRLVDSGEMCVSSAYLATSVLLCLFFGLFSITAVLLWLFRFSKASK